jgi:hypothetical protein
MKKIFYQLIQSLCMILLSLTAFSQTEMNYWTLPPYKVDFTGANPVATTLPGNPAAVEYTVSNGV